MSELISVIIPVYKVEKYLEKCLDSVIAQTYRNLEILVVDDGSPDGSPAICDRYAAKDSRIKVFHIENGGVSAARNYALDRAKGEYIAFVDSDDFIEPDMIEKLYDRLQRTGCKAAVCGRYIEADGKTSTGNVSAGEEIYDTKAYLKGYYELRLGFVCWDKLYRAEVWDGIRFPQGHYYEDLWLGPQILEACGRIAAVPEALYHYVLRGGSTIHSFTYPIITDAWESKKAIADYARKKCPELDEITDQFELVNYMSYWYQLNMIDGDGSETGRKKKEIRKAAAQMSRRCSLKGIPRIRQVKILMMLYCPWAAEAAYGLAKKRHARKLG